MIFWNVRVRDKVTDNVLDDSFFREKSNAIELEETLRDEFNVSITAISIK